MSAPQRRRADATNNSRPRITRAERRRQLLEIARQHFETRGYERTLLAEIAAEAGITERMLARYFPAKVDLFREIVEEVKTATLGRWKEFPDGATDPLARLHAVADSYLTATATLPRELSILHRALAEGTSREVLDVMRDFSQEVETFLAGIIAEGQLSGVFRRSLDPRVGAWQLIRTAIGYILTRPLGVPIDAEPDYLPRAVDCLLHCLLKTDV